MDLFPTLLEEYDLTGHEKGVNEFRDHIMKGIEDNMHRGHSLANGVSSHGGFDPLGAPASQDILKAFQECLNHYVDKMGHIGL